MRRNADSSGWFIWCSELVGRLPVGRCLILAIYLYLCFDNSFVRNCFNILGPVSLAQANRNMDVIRVKNEIDNRKSIQVPKLQIIYNVDRIRIEMKLIYGVSEGYANVRGVGDCAHVSFLAKCS